MIPMRARPACARPLNVPVDVLARLAVRIDDADQLDAR
jgi:hypothetical protein